VATRSGDLLERRRQLLADEENRPRTLTESSRREWEDAAVEAQRWLHRAVVSGGGQQLRLAVAHLSQRAEVRVTWRGIMGVTVAEAPECSLSEPRDVAAVGGTVALGSALREAARHAVRRARWRVW
jgi:vacuolar-type H+-ATPase subunit D/Vma8